MITENGGMYETVATVALQLEPYAGTNIEKVCKQAYFVHVDTGYPVTFDFNNIKVTFTEKI